MATGTRARTAPLSPLQDSDSREVGALSLATLLALRVRGDRRFRERASGVVAADDRLLSPAIARVVTFEHRRQRAPRSVSRSRNSCLAARTTERGVSGAVVQARRRYNLVDGP